jgi:O-antigen/teichoic acid export membrane protein
MREQLKTLSTETLIYGVSTVVGRFLNFLLVPFYVNVLRSTAEYGIATSLYTYMGFLNVIYPLGLEAAYFRYAARAEGEPFRREREAMLFSAPFLFLFAASALFSAALFFFARALVWPVFHDPHIDITSMTPMLLRILRLGAGILFFDSLAVLPFAALRLEHRAWRFATLRLIGIVLTLTLNFIFIVGKGWGVPGIFVANLVSSIFVFCLLLPTIWERFAWRVDRSTLRTMLPFGLTNVPAYLSAMMVQVIDRPIVQAFLGLGILGIYQANYRMGFVMMVFVSLFEYAWRPFFLRQAATDDARARHIFSRVLTYFMGLSLYGFLALSWALPFIVSFPVRGHSLLRPVYLSGLPIIPVILFAYVFQGMYTNFIVGIYVKEHNKVLPFITGLGAVVNIVANLLLIPRLGIMGAALATLFAYMAMALAIYWQAQKVYFIAYDWPRVAWLFGAVGAAYAAERALRLGGAISSGMPSLLLKIGLLGGSVAVLFVAGFFTAGERAFLRERLWRMPGEGRSSPKSFV